MQTYKMSRSTAVLITFLITFLMMIGLAILASSCSNEQNLQKQTTQVEILDYPYEWDTVHYNRIISSVNSETTSIKFDIKVTFNEEFVEIVNIEFVEEPIIFIGRWTDKCTFIIDNNFGVVSINLSTGFMTIVYQGDIKEIYTH